MPFEENRLLPLVERLSTPLMRREERNHVATRVLLESYTAALNDEFLVFDANSATLTLPGAASSDARVIVAKIRPGASGALSWALANAFETIDFAYYAASSAAGVSLALVCDRGRWFTLYGTATLTAIIYAVLWYVGFMPWTGMNIGDAAFNERAIRSWYALQPAQYLFNYQEFA